MKNKKTMKVEDEKIQKKQKNEFNKFFYIYKWENFCIKEIKNTIFYYYQLLLKKIQRKNIDEKIKN